MACASPLGLLQGWCDLVLLGCPLEAARGSVLCYLRRQACARLPRACVSPRPRPSVEWAPGT